MLCGWPRGCQGQAFTPSSRSEEHTSELQSQSNLVCRLLLEKKKKTAYSTTLSAKLNDAPAPLKASRTHTGNVSRDTRLLDTGSSQTSHFEATTMSRHLTALS